MFKRFSLLALLAVSITANAAPPPKGVMPHFEGMETGLIEGTIFNVDAAGKRTPLADQPIAIIVFKDGKRILMVDKKADAKGAFTVQNVFKDPSFVYALGTLFEEKLYVLPNIQVKKGEDKKTVEFAVGAGSPYQVDDANHPQMNAQQGAASTPVDMGMPAGDQAKSEFSVASAFSHAHQKSALFLCGLVLVLALIFGLKQKQPS